MTDGDSIAQVAVVILLLSLAVPALSTAYDYAGTPIEYEETATVNYTDPYEVEQNATEAEDYGENVTVTAQDNNQELTAGEDYEWNASTGVVNWLNTTDTKEGDTISVSYRAYQRTGESEMAWTLISPFMALFGLFGLIAGVRALWQFTAEVWDL